MTETLSETVSNNRVGDPLDHYQRASQGSRMEFERYTITLLIHRSSGPEITEEDRAEFQQAHVLYRAALAEEGYLLASGELADDDVCELSILGVDARKACLLEEADPAVRAGMYTVWAVPWIVPAGTITFSPAPADSRTQAESGWPAGRTRSLPADSRLSV
jgi:hypothetical protein